MQTQSLIDIPRFEVSLSFSEREQTAGGSQIKWHADGLWYKASDLGYPDIAEWLATELLKCSNMDVGEYVAYDLGYVVYSDMGLRYNAVRADSFLAEGEEFIPFAQLVEGSSIPSYALGRPENWVTEMAELLDYLERVTGLRLQTYLAKAAAIDALILNDDRNGHNIGVIRKADGSYRLAPYFDHARAFLSSVSHWPYGIPLDGQVSAVLPAAIVGSFAAHMALFPPSGLRFDTRRVAALLDRYGRSLGRAGDVLRYQMQQYPEFFI